MADFAGHAPRDAGEEFSFVDRGTHVTRSVTCENLQESVASCDQALLVWKERRGGPFAKFGSVVLRVRVPPD